MNLKTKKRIAAKVLKCSPKKVKLDNVALDKVNDAITRADIKSLVSRSVIQKKQDKGVSRARAKKRAEQKKKGRRKGPGRRKGKFSARLPQKEAWMNKIRALRNLLLKLKEAGKISVKDYRDLYLKAKGGFFRSRRHIKLYIEEKELLKK